MKDNTDNHIAKNMFHRAVGDSTTGISFGQIILILRVVFIFNVLNIGEQTKKTYFEVSIHPTLFTLVDFFVLL